VVHWLYRVCYPIVRLGFALFSRRQVIGRENVPREGPLLVACNHMTNFDPPLLSISLGRYLTFMAKEELFRSPLAAFFLSRLGSFSVRRGRIDRQAMRLAEKVLANGGALVVFPEGQRSRSSQLRQAFSGAAAIAQRYGVPILPVGITGTEQVGSVRHLLRRPRVTVTIGPTFRLPAVRGRSQRAESTEQIMRRIAGVLPREYRGVYSEEKSG